MIALATQLPKLSFGGATAGYTAVGHLNGAGSGVVHGKGTAGLLLQGVESETALDHLIGRSKWSEQWRVVDDCLVQGNTVQPHIVRNIGGCRTGVLGVSLTTGGPEWRTRIGELADRSAALKEKEACSRVFVVVDTPEDAPLGDSDIERIVRAGSHVDQWFLSIQSKKYKRHFVKCLTDAVKTQVLVSVHVSDSNMETQQQIEYQSGLVTRVRGNCRLV